MLKNPKLIQGHYECRRFDETLPVFTDLLGMEVIQHYLNVNSRLTLEIDL